MKDLLAFLDEQYAAGPFSILSTLATNGQRKAYCLESPGGKLVAKVTDPGRPESVVRADVGTPDYLSARGFPVPRPLAARDERLYLSYEDRFVYLYDYIEGEHPKPRDDFYRRLGALFGRLHSIPPDGKVPASDYTPGSILAHAREMLVRSDTFLGDPGNLSQEALPGIVPELVAMIDRFPSFEGLPLGIIHTDPYFVNLIETPTGALYLIDWEDGGVMYPLLDVGYVLAHLCSFTARDRRVWSVAGPEEGIVSRPDWGRIFMAAYEAIRPLSVLERALLPDAVRLSFLAYMVEFETGGLILDNYLRMKCFNIPGSDVPWG